MLKQTGLALLTLALGACAGVGPGKRADPAHPGYVTSAAGIVTNPFGACWHTRAWTPAMALEPCDHVTVVQAPAPPAPPKEATKIAQPALQQPAPQPAPEPAPVIERVALDTELLFDFDSAVLRAEGRGKLDEIAVKLHRARIDSIEAIGHADRIASHGYNQELSEDRAAAVKDYLARLGFDPRDIRAEGHGEREPVTGSRCMGLGPENRENLKLVRCLQPDRRVELEVRGLKAHA